MNETRKEHFTTIWRQYTFTIEGLATEAGVAESVILAMLEGTRIAQGVATHVLATFARLANKPYTLSNVEIALVDEGTSEVARALRQIDEETEAMMQGLSGLALGTARHEIIGARWDAILGPHHNTLVRANQT